LSLHALEQRSGVKRASLMRFMRGEQSLRLDLADKLAAFFGFELESVLHKESNSMKNDAAFLCVADEKWLDFLAGKDQAVYWKGAGRPLRRLDAGRPFVCCRHDEWPLRIHLIGRFVECRVLTKEEAWERYGTALGAPTKRAWESQTGESPSVSESRYVAC